MKADLQELEETAAPCSESSEIQLARLQRELDECRLRLAQAQSLLANVPAALLIADPEARIVDANLAVCALLGYEKNELLAMEPWAFVTNPARQEFVTLISSEIFDEQATLQVVCSRKDGREITVELLVAELNQAGRDLLTVSCRDVTAQKQSQLALEKALQESQALKDQFRLAVDTSPALVWTALPDGSRDFHNQRWLEFTGLSFEEGLGWGWQRAFHPQDLIRFENHWREAVSLSQPLEAEIRLRSASGEYRWFLLRARPLHDDSGNLLKWYGTTTDIHDRKQAETLLAGENRVLELITKGSVLAPILEGLCRLVEEILSDALASILLLDRTENRLWHGAAPSLPTSYTKAIDGAAIGPAAGSCGTAAFRGEPVFVSDIATNALWTDYRELALPHGLRACWSTPIFSTDRNVLGTFAIYSREPGNPTPQHSHIIDQITHLAALAIERQRIQSALQSSEERFRQMADAIAEVIWITALEPEKVLYASPSFERIWGRPVHELYQNPRLWSETIHPDDRERVTDIFKRWIAGASVDCHDIEFRIVQPNGSIRWIHGRGVLRCHDQGKPFLASGISTDITESKDAHDALRRSESYLAEAQRLSCTGSFGWNVASGKLFWSKETFCIVGYDPATEPTVELVLRRVHPEDLELVQRALDQASRDGTDMDFEHRLLFPDGSIKYLHVLARAVRDELGHFEYFGAVMDVTEQHQAHTALETAHAEIRKSEDQLRTIIDRIPTLAWCCWPDGTTEFLNQRWLEYTGFSMPEALGWGWQNAIHHEDLPNLMRTWLRILDAGEPGEAEARLRRFDGEYRWFLFRALPVRDESGKIVRWYGTDTDIEELKQAEAKLRRDERELRRITDAIPQAISVLAPDGTMLYANEVVLDSTGLRLDGSTADVL